MTCKEIKYYLNDYADGHLINEVRNEIASHLDNCINCKNRYLNIISILKEASTLPKDITSSRDIRKLINQKPKKNNATLKILSINHLDNYPDTGSKRKKFTLKKKYRRSGWFFASAVAIAIVLGIGLGIFYYSQYSFELWSVDNLAGMPVVGAHDLIKHGAIKTGEWLQTNSVSRARLNVGSIGEIDVQPSSKIKLLGSPKDEYKISLKEGKIHAVIWSSPGTFSVETPSATAIDFGCIYTLEVNKDGSGLLKVMSGCVELKSGNTKSLIPAEAMCKTDKTFGTGTPYFNDATTEFKDALNNFDQNKDKSSALSTLLKESRKKDALTLWHILTKVKDNQKQETYNRIAELVNIPSTVTLQGIMNGNKEMMTALLETLGYSKKLPL